MDKLIITCMILFIFHIRLGEEESTECKFISTPKELLDLVSFDDFFCNLAYKNCVFDVDKYNNITILILSPYNEKVIPVDNDSYTIKGYLCLNEDVFRNTLCNYNLIEDDVKIYKENLIREVKSCYGIDLLFSCNRESSELNSDSSTSKSTKLRFIFNLNENLFLFIVLSRLFLF